MDFDKKTILAFVIIGLILIFMQTDFYKKNFLPPEPPRQELGQENPEKASGEEKPEKASVKPQNTPVAEAEQTPEPEPKQHSWAETHLLSVAQKPAEEIVVENDLYRAVFSTRGGALVSWTLKKYTMLDSLQVQMIREADYGNLGILLPTDGDTLDISSLVFDVNKKQVRLNDARESDQLVFTLDLDSGRRIVKTYTFEKDSYSFQMDVEFVNLKRFVQGYAYYLTWNSGLNSTEPDLNVDMRSAKTYALQGDLVVYDAKDDFDPGDWDNPTDWVAVRTKYFVLAVIPRDQKGQKVEIEGQELETGQKTKLKSYAFKLQMPFESGNDVTSRFTVYLGPIDYDILKSYNVGLERLMDFGMAIFRPFAKFTLWSFTLLHKVIPNYGWVIILFSILIKIVLFPLTRKSYQSMKEMQALQPMMQEINEKYKDDAQKKQQEIMKLYKEYGINPLGGCIPMLLQMPLLIGLFNVFRSTIELRGAPFIGWITDLSRPDTVAMLPFTLPLYGNHVSILPLIMGVTMFIQQKISVKDPKQKAMVYFMPLFMTLLFNSFPSGLNLYYALFNIFSIIQEKIVPYKIRTPEEIKAQSKKKTKRRRQKHDYRGRN